jgi:hypothetical protein
MPIIPPFRKLRQKIEFEASLSYIGSPGQSGLYRETPFQFKGGKRESERNGGGGREEGRKEGRQYY